MRRLLSTRFGFFGFAALLCWAMLAVIEKEHRWVAIGLGALYAILSVLFFFDEASRARRVPTPKIDQAPSPFDPPPPPGQP